MLHVKDEDGDQLFRDICVAEAVLTDAGLVTSNDVTLKDHEALLDRVEKWNEAVASHDASMFEIAKQVMGGWAAPLGRVSHYFVQGTSACKTMKYNGRTVPMSSIPSNACDRCRKARKEMSS